MELSSKNAPRFAATGAIASGVAHAFAGQGAHVWLSGRRQDGLDALAEAIRSAGGAASTAVVDATNSAEVTSYVDRVASEAGRIDVVFNGIGGRPADLGYPARSEEQDIEHFLLPLRIILASTFLTSRAAAARMAGQGHGSIVTLSASLSGLAVPYMAGITATCGAIEAMTRAFAGEFGPAGVRANCVRATAMPETRTIAETAAGSARIAGPTATAMMSAPTPLGRPITVADTARVATFLASDASSGMTGQVVNVCGGTMLD